MTDQIIDHASERSDVIAIVEIHIRGKSDCECDENDEEEISHLSLPSLEDKSIGFRNTPSILRDWFARGPHRDRLDSSGPRFVSAKFDGEFARSSQTYVGTGTVRYVW